MSTHFYHSGASIYRETSDSLGNRANCWLASTQCETGVAPTARELNEAITVARMLDSHADLLAACKQFVSCWPRPINASHDDIRAATAAAEAAISKAKGEWGT